MQSSAPAPGAPSPIVQSYPKCAYSKDSFGRLGAVCSTQHSARRDSTFATAAVACAVRRERGEQRPPRVPRPHFRRALVHARLQWRVAAWGRLQWRNTQLRKTPRVNKQGKSHTSLEINPIEYRGYNRGRNMSAITNRDSLSSNEEGHRGPNDNARCGTASAAGSVSHSAATITVSKDRNTVAGRGS